MSKVENLKCGMWEYFAHDSVGQTAQDCQLCKSEVKFASGSAQNVLIHPPTLPPSLPPSSDPKFTVTWIINMFNAACNVLITEVTKRM